MEVFFSPPWKWSSKADCMCSWPFTVI